MPARWTEKVVDELVTPAQRLAGAAIIDAQHHPCAAWC
jgi:hypothetical protein